MQLPSSLAWGRKQFRTVLAQNVNMYNSISGKTLVILMFLCKLPSPFVLLSITFILSLVCIVSLFVFERMMWGMVQRCYVEAWNDLVWWHCEVLTLNTTALEVDRWRKMYWKYQSINDYGWSWMVDYTIHVLGDNHFSLVLLAVEQTLGRNTGTDAPKFGLKGALIVLPHPAFGRNPEATTDESLS